MGKKFLGAAGAVAAVFATVLCLLPGGAVAEASSQTYDLSNGSITITAKSDGCQYVTQVGGVTDELQTGETIITDGSMQNTISIVAEEGQTARVAFYQVYNDLSGTGGEATVGDAAVSVSGEGDAVIALSGSNVLKSGLGRAGIEKSNTGSLTITADSTASSLLVTGGAGGAGIGGGISTGASDIIISGGLIKATGGQNAAGIGGGGAGDGSSITISGGSVTATGGQCGAGIGGGGGGRGTGINITGGTVVAKGGEAGGAGIGGGAEASGSNVTVSGNTVLIVQGGIAFSMWGAGAGIGNGGSQDSESQPTGSEVKPNTDELTSYGEINYYRPGADTGSDDPVRTIYGHDHSYTKEVVEERYFKSAATCASGATYYKSCATCGRSAEGSDEDATFEYGDKDSNNHVNIVHHDAQQATCTEAGWKAYEACTGCNYSTYSEIPATGHNFTAEVAESKYLASAATCTAKATYYKSCSVCGLSSKGTEREATFESGDKDPNNHVNIVHHDAQEATCTEAGWKAYEACTGCNYSTYSEIPATGHSFTAEVAEAKYLATAATCTAKATYYKSCSVCGLSSRGTEHEATFEHGEALGHTPEILPAKDATCTEDGLTEGEKCSVCGEVLKAQQGIHATGHKGGTATCAHKAKCETCGEEYGELDPANHEALTHVAAKEATTTSEGNIEYWYCPACGKYYADSAATKEISHADTVIAKKSDSKGDEKGDGDSDKKSDGDKADGEDSDKKDGGEKKSNKKALPATGDDAAVQMTVLLTAGITALGAAFITRKRAA